MRTFRHSDIMSTGPSTDLSTDLSPDLSTDLSPDLSPDLSKLNLGDRYSCLQLNYGETAEDMEHAWSICKAIIANQKCIDERRRQEDADVD